MDHLHGGVMSAGQCDPDLGPDAHSPLANEAVAAKWFTDRICSAGHATVPQIVGPRDAIQNTAVVHTRDPARFVRQLRLDGSPFVVVEFVAHDEAPVWGLKITRWARPSTRKGPSRQMTMP